MFESKKILDRLPEDRFFNVTCTMRVVPSGYFKVLMTISVVAKTMVSEWKYGTHKCRSASMAFRMSSEKPKINFWSHL